MATIGSLNLKLGLNSSSFDTGMSKAASSIGAFSSMATAAFTGISAFKDVIDIGARVATSLVDVGTDAVMTAARFESMQISLEAMTGSAAKAKDVIDQLVKIAAATPFTMESLTPAVQRMMAFGFEADESIALVTRLGDMAAAMPQGMEEGIQRMTIAIGQMRGKQRVMTQEMNQLTETGLPVWDALAKRLNTDVAGAMKKVELGAVDAKTGIQAIMDLAESPKFAGLGEKRSKGVEGLLSTLSDNFTMGKKALGDDITEAFGIKGVINDITWLVKESQTAFAPLKPVLIFVGDLFRATWEVAFEGTKALLSAIRGIGTTLEGQMPSFGEIRSAVIDFSEHVVLSLTKVGFAAAKMGAYWLEALAIPMVDAMAWVSKAHTDMNRAMVAGNPVLAARMGLTEASIRTSDRMTAGLERTGQALRDMAVAGQRLTMQDLDNMQGGVVRVFENMRNKDMIAESSAAGVVLGAAFIGGIRKKVEGFKMPELDLKMSGIKNLDPKKYIDALITPQERLKTTIGELNQLVSVGALTWDQYFVSVQMATKEMMKLTDVKKKFETPGLVQKGSKEAFSAMNAWMNEGRGGPGGKGEALAKPMDALVRIQEMAKELQKLQLAQLQKIAANVAPLVLGKV